ncbi:prepilin-type N-terminal cleavage/methylation domain-containing protein [Thalassotalea castellviae]|uniref:Prepilin-type N-terminal cleavage/methylation domain-containing protein n=1 Tax=Thalassotalea castellviae TaxID=3075612 RepID=A0ABU2ZY09_9GAMM|nr:prepilin-type N-terminal cleavage/methylation domain-containing protein [Thalassotalea sp. W431]MDT0602814.1 prepilin-type N-terminal cleavage/methylation domain-containing protein [Thalassotalea sp. W431]
MIKRANHKAIKGFTLIELMIAISILSLLLLTGSYTYSLMSSRWSKELGNFAIAEKNAKHIELTQRLLEGIQSFIVVNPQKKPFFFFIGHNTSLLAVSQSGFFANEVSEIFRLSAVEKSSGLFDLVYQSKSTQNLLLKGTEQIIEFDQSLVLFSDLTQISFEYFGWRNIDEKTNDEQNNFAPFWQQSYSGIDKQYMPEKLTLTLVKNNKILVMPIMLQTNVQSWLSPYINSDT